MSPFIFRLHTTSTTHTDFLLSPLFWLLLRTLHFFRILSLLKVSRVALLSFASFLATPPGFGLRIRASLIRRYQLETRTHSWPRRTRTPTLPPKEQFVYSLSVKHLSAYTFEESVYDHLLSRESEGIVRRSSTITTVYRSRACYIRFISCRETVNDLINLRGIVF